MQRSFHVAQFLCSTIACGKSLVIFWMNEWMNEFNKITSAVSATDSCKELRPFHIAIMDTFEFKSLGSFKQMKERWMKQTFLKVDPVSKQCAFQVTVQ